MDIEDTEITSTLAVLTYEELIDAVMKAAIKKDKSLKKVENPVVNFRWGRSFGSEEPHEGIFATVDVVIDVEDATDATVDASAEEPPSPETQES